MGDGAWEFRARRACASDPEMAGGGSRLSCPPGTVGCCLLPLLRFGEEDAGGGDMRLLLMASFASDDC